MKIPARIVSIQRETPTVKLFRLDLGEREIRFLPGQWVDCYAGIDGQQEVAGYSMTSSPLETRTIDLAVKLIGENPVTHFLHQRAVVGNELYLDGAHGDFYYRREMGDSLVLIGGGIGLTPLMSIIRYVDESQPEVRLTLLYSAKTPSELLFRDQLTAISARNHGIRCLFSVTRPSTEPWSGRTGRIDAQVLSEAQLDLDALYYICGPPSMIERTAGLLEGLGVPVYAIKYESW